MLIENAIGGAFMQLLVDTQGHSPRNPSSENNAIHSFVKDVRRRKAQPHGTYDDLVDMAAVAAARILVYGGDCHDESRKDPASITLYRKMRWLVKRVSAGAHTSAPDQPSLATRDSHHDEGILEFEAIERQELLNEAYDSGYSAGFEAGIRAGAAQDLQRSSQMSYSEGFAAGQRAEMDRVRTSAAEMSSRTGHNAVIPGLVPEPALHWSQPLQQGEAAPSASGSRLPGNLQPESQTSGRDTPPVRPSPAQEPWTGAMLTSSIGSSCRVSGDTAELSQLGPAYEAHMQIRREARHRNDADPRNVTVTCVFCGREVTANSLMRHKKRRHPAELAAAGVELQGYPCWWPGCGMLKDNLVPNQLTTHLQRQHNYAYPGDPNAFTENIKYYNRMVRSVVVSIISESAQELNAVKERIRRLEAQLRAQNTSYVSRHGLPNLNQLHETRPWVIDYLDKTFLPLAVQELHQLRRARGMRSQIRHDEGTWWEVADDLEAALNPSGALARAVAALPPPGDGPTVHMNAGTLVEGPNMNDPSWSPRYAPLFKPNWQPAASGVEDADGVVLPPNTAIRRTKFEIVIPSFSRPASTAQEHVEEDEEEKEGFQRLMAEIEKRVTDDDAEVDWNEMDYDGTEEEVEDGEAQYDAMPSTRPSSQQQKRPGASSLLPGRKKRHKSGHSDERRGDDLG